MEHFESNPCLPKIRIRFPGQSRDDIRSQADVGWFLAMVIKASTRDVVRTPRFILSRTRGWRIAGRYDNGGKSWAVAGTNPGIPALAGALPAKRGAGAPGRFASPTISTNREAPAARASLDPEADIRSGEDDFQRPLGEQFAAPADTPEGMLRDGPRS